MKTVRKFGQWWIGLQVKCKSCKIVMKLEVLDKPFPDYDSKDLFVVMCPFCNSPLNVPYVSANQMNADEREQSC